MRKLGGESSDPMPVPSMGWFATCTDPHGNEFGIWQTDPSAQIPEAWKSLAPTRGAAAVVTLEQVRALAMTLPRQRGVRARPRKFRVGRIVYVAFSRDETLMGFGFPKDERVWLVGTEPEKFLMPRDSDLRYNWVVVRLAAIDAEEMRGLVIDAWAMCVPKSVSAQYRE